MNLSRITLTAIVFCLPTLAQGFPASIELTCVDAAAHSYGTFQSHNQKVLQNQHGIFMTHLRTRNEEYTAQQWRLSRSLDGGKSFSTIFEETHATNPPVIETDAAGNLYLARPDFVGGDAYVYRFLAEKGFKDPIISTLPGGAAGKYCMMIDEPRGRLYFFSHNGRFFTVSIAGEVVSRVDLLKDGANAALQYPLLALEADGTLHAAWTTVKHGVYLYWDIHHMLSRDGGATWRNMGSDALLELPVVADDTGPATRVSLEDEFEGHTWLSSFVVQGGKAHFLYLAQLPEPRQHYVRYDIATGKEERRIQPVFSGQTLRIQSLDGLVATGRDETTIFAIGNNGGHLACLRSTDNGDTWEDWAQTEQTFGLYAIGGMRNVTTDDYVIGSFTDSATQTSSTASESKVYFWRVRADDET